MPERGLELKVGPGPVQGARIGRVRTQGDVMSDSGVRKDGGVLGGHAHSRERLVFFAKNGDFYE